MLEKWALDLFQKEEAEPQLYPDFEQFLLGTYRRARHDEAVDSAFGLGSPFAEEFSQFLTTIPCPDFLADEAQSDFAYYREMFDEGFPHSFLLRYVGERREGLKREEAFNRVFSDLDLEDQFEILYDYLLAHGESEHTATDCSLNALGEIPLTDALPIFQEREREEERMRGLGFSPDRAYAYAKAISEDCSSEQAGLYSWYFEKQMQWKLEREWAQDLAKEFARIAPLYASLYENKNYETNIDAFTHVEASHHCHQQNLEEDFRELFMTVAERLQPQKKKGEEVQFYSQVETLTRKIGRGEIALNDLPGTPPPKPEKWRVALRRYRREEKREWEEISSEPDLSQDFHQDPAIARATSSFEDSLKRNAIDGDSVH
ncbi:MAG: hypothetical protein ACSHYB_18585 [Roseibacillus sp.]